MPKVENRNTDLIESPEAMGKSFLQLKPTLQTIDTNQKSGKRSTTPLVGSKRDGVRKALQFK